MPFVPFVPVHVSGQVFLVPEVEFAGLTLIRPCLDHQARQEFWNQRMFILTSLVPLMAQKAIKLRAMLGAVGAFEVAAFAFLTRR